MIREIKIKDSHVSELIEVYGEFYMPEIPDVEGNLIPNPQTKAQFAGQNFDAEVRQGVVRKVQDYRKRKAIEALTVDTTDITED